MTLQKIAAAESAEAAKILADYWTGRGMPEYDAKWAEAYLKEGHRKEVKSDEFFAYKEGDKLIGTISLILDVSGVAEIRDLVVKPEFRGKGYGKKIVSELIAIAKKKNARKLFALTKIEGLFKSAGFDKEGILKSHFAKGEDLVIMSKFL